jgi:hypothetical protein
VADAWDELIARHRLTFGEAVRIRDEVGAGRAFAEPHLRAAAADWARHLLEREGFAHLWASRWRRIVLVVSLVVLLAEIVRGLLDVHAGAHPSALRLWTLAFLTAANLLARWNRRRLLRATVTHNEPRPPA